MIPPRTILAVTDFSDSARTALTLAARLATHMSAALHVLHVEDTLLATAARHAGIDIGAETRAALAEAVTAVPAAAALQPGTHVHAGAAVETICASARRIGIDLIVMGMRGMSGAEHLIFGSTTEGVLRRADTSVIAVPDSWAPPDADGRTLAGIGPIIAGVDFSAASFSAAAAGCRLAAGLGTSVELVHVVADSTVPARWRSHAASALAERTTQAARELDAFVGRLDAAVPVQPRVESGPVARCLAGIAAPAPGRQPLIVLGRGATPDAGPGATAYRVLAYATAPVLVHVGI